MDVVLSDEELAMVIDALQFYACTDISTDYSPERCEEMADLSVSLAKSINYVSETNVVDMNLIHEDADIVKKLEPYIKQKGEEDES